MILPSHSRLNAHNNNQKTYLENMEWHKLIGNWRDWMVAAGRPSTTVRLRVYQMRRFAEDHPRGASTQQMIGWLAGAGWSVETRKSFRAALVNFHRWAVTFGHLTEDPTRLLPPVKSIPHPPRPAPESVVAAALLAGDARVQLMVGLAAFLGLRRGEIARVHSDDLFEDLAGWSLVVHGKGGKDRTVPVVGRLLDELGDRGPGWVFPSPRGGHLTEQHVGKLIGRVLPDGWTAHTLRHRFATVAYAGTRDLFAVQELLGHSRPETTRGYVLLPGESLRLAVAAAGPAQVAA